MDHLALCDYTRVCSHSKGLIASIDYPQLYAQRTTCSWAIITDAGTFIKLVFLDLDIPSIGQCDSSSLTISNSQDDEMEMFAIGTFCDTRRPPSSILSNYNQLFLTFRSGAEDAGNGFLAEYTQLRRDKVPHIPDVPGRNLSICIITIRECEYCCRLIYKKYSLIIKCYPLASVCINFQITNLLFIHLFLPNNTSKISK